MTPRTVRSIRLIRLDVDLAADGSLLRVFSSNGLKRPTVPEWSQVREVAEQTAALLSRAPRPAPWIGYLVADSNESEAVGVCGFKTAPIDGVVEIAYFTFPRFEGRGVATAAASALVELARSSRPVPRVIARTLREANASTRVLEKCGFSFAGDVMDPEDGLVWQWEYSAKQPVRAATVRDR